MSLVDYKDRILQWREEGEGYLKIARRLGVTPTSVKRFLKRRGLLPVKETTDGHSQDNK